MTLAYRAICPRYCISDPACNNTEVIGSDQRECDHHLLKVNTILYFFLDLQP